MTRMKIAQEGVPTTDGRMIVHGGLQWEREAIPVTLASNGQMVGTADKIRREPYGAITAEVDAAGIEGLYPEIACDQIIEDVLGPAPMTMRRLRLRFIAFGERPAWDDLG